ncbi:MAG: DNA polymerase III subunit gamma/tau [Lachnospiraceae bacterium]|nr:DNA polymerase III subunit gamma/tau [Lachnospiraceae bacterium]
MSYVALYRKFRPQTFSLVKGQEHVVRTLKNQIKNNRIGHAYLFTGTRGTGKTSVAKIFAKAVNCLNPMDGEPCNECEHCRSVAAGNFIDVVEIDAASNTGVDDIRRVIEEIQYTPVKGRYKVYIIDEAHMLTGNAANAFLKTLEEPPEYAIFILATTEPHKLPITILSRCQRYDFKRISVDTIAENLTYLLNSEQVEFEEKAVRYVARAADGSMRDSISLLDKCIAFNLGEKLTYENVLTTLGVVDTEIFSKMFRAIAGGDVITALSCIEETVDAGKDISQFVADFIMYLRNLLLVNVSGGVNKESLGISEENMKVLSEDAYLVDSNILMRYLRILSELMNQIRYSPTKQILLEIAVIKLARPQMETDTASLEDRIRQLEDKVKNGVTMALPVREARPSHPDIVRMDLEEEMDIPEMYYEPDYFEPEYEEFDIPEPDFPLPKPKRKTSAMDVLQEMAPTAAPAPATPAPATASGAGNAAAVCDQWQKILAGCSNRMMKSAFSRVSVAAEGNMVVIYPPGNTSYKQLKDDEAVQYIKSVIKEVTGYEVAIDVRMASQKAEIPNQADLASIFENINMTITTED